jgi:hypothetical protein
VHGDVNTVARSPHGATIGVCTAIEGCDLGCGPTIPCILGSGARKLLLAVLEGMPAASSRDIGVARPADVELPSPRPGRGGALTGEPPRGGVATNQNRASGISQAACRERRRSYVGCRRRWLSVRFRGGFCRRSWRGQRNHIPKTRWPMTARPELTIARPRNVTE